MRTQVVVASRFFSDRYARLVEAMSLAEAQSLLGVSSGASPEIINKAYRVKALENHPDRGGSNEMMVKLNVARDVLTGKQRPTFDRPSPSPSPARPYSPPPAPARPAPSADENVGRGIASSLEGMSSKYREYLDANIGGRWTVAVRPRSNSGSGLVSMVFSSSSFSDLISINLAVFHKLSYRVVCTSQTTSFPAIQSTAEFNTIEQLFDGIAQPRKILEGIASQVSYQVSKTQPSEAMDEKAFIASLVKEKRSYSLFLESLLPSTGYWTLTGVGSYGFTFSSEGGEITGMVTDLGGQKMQVTWSVSGAEWPNFPVVKVICSALDGGTPRAVFGDLVAKMREYLAQSRKVPGTPLNFNGLPKASWKVAGCEMSGGSRGETGVYTISILMVGSIDPDNWCVFAANLRPEQTVQAEGRVYAESWTTAFIRLPLKRAVSSIPQAIKSLQSALTERVPGCLLPKKFVVLGTPFEGLTEADLQRCRHIKGRLSLKDALAGAGLLGGAGSPAPGRKVQVEMIAGGSYDQYDVFQHSISLAFNGREFPVSEAGMQAIRQDKVLSTAFFKARTSPGSRVNLTTIRAVSPIAVLTRLSEVLENESSALTLNILTALESFEGAKTAARILANFSVFDAEILFGREPMDLLSEAWETKTPLLTGFCGYP